MIRDLLRLPKTVESDIASALEAIYETGYTGPITFHFKAGIARTIQVPSPEIRLTRAADPPSTPPPAPTLSTPDRPARLLRS